MNDKLNEKYALATGRLIMTGVQALVRLPLTQHRLDQARGLNTAGYISGYRGSPLGMYDAELGKAKALLDAARVKFVPGVNEDLAATAVWGSQQAEVAGEGLYDGVFGLWYGKGPGVDRSGDAFRHANLAGSSRHGGVLLVMGDDHTCESSSTCHQSEFALMDAHIPVLDPCGVREILEYGLFGWAMSRFTGCWVGLKCVKETADATASFHFDESALAIVEPAMADLPADGLNIRLPDTPHAQEVRMQRHKLRAVHAFVRANRLDRVIAENPGARIGIVTHGKSYLDVLQAFEILGFPEENIADAGVRLLKLACTWPVEPEIVRDFASGLDLLIVVEEKRSLVEAQIKDILYDTGSPPRIIGKRDEHKQVLFPVEMALDPVQIAVALGRRLPIHAPALADRLASLDRILTREPLKEAMARSFYFCAGCPHNSSTVLPEGSKGYAGIGCAWMSQYMDRNTLGFTHMGAEGLAWVGEQPFSKRTHMFQNLGDGTYFHSGILAIRAAVAAKANITYKILFNDAVAMTGGQRHDGPLSVPLIAAQVQAEGVKDIVVVTDDPGKYTKGDALPGGIRAYHRDELQRIQTELRAIPGVTALIYDQTCAAEKRRRRKRGEYPDPAKRFVINETVCEGCGDCGKKSNCVAVVPVETDLGRKRAIDQDACNKDYSCNKGFCPSFVTVYGGSRRKQTGTGADALAEHLREPTLPALSSGSYAIILTGVGGTGVTTVSAVLSMAAHLEGKATGGLDMAGLAQKGGAVWTHLRIAASDQHINAIRVPPGGADLIVGYDMVVASQAKTLATTLRGKTRLVVNSHRIMPGEFTRKPDLVFPIDALRMQITKAVGNGYVDFINATHIATTLCGDSVATNFFLIGFAYQLGLLPLHAESIQRAIALNGVAVKMNQDAFTWGRLAAQDGEAVESAIKKVRGVPPHQANSLDDLIEVHRKFLTQYQNQAYAQKYERLVRRISEWEARNFSASTRLSLEVARSYFKLLAYKDEYEVARLHSDPAFLERINREFEGDFTLKFNLAPPGIAKVDPISGEPRKIEFGGWMLPVFRVLARLKFLRGTAFDPFGHTAERKMERALIGRYEATVEAIMMEVRDEASFEQAVRMAKIPQSIKGYGHVKDKAFKDVDLRWNDALLKSTTEQEAPPRKEVASL
ncbi:indolepyruvate ferredoxin oxidoreductase family protein [Pseudorhodoferax sp.]|uniref:indolepyruvate ferredoxin oxidoreductase family protein n=1 Tax=Pseudorhodoferax sp. TaxID=1993553 RepID=UPI0039E27008